MILTKLTLRHYTRHPWQIMLSILGVTLGVAVVVAIDLTNSSARRALELASTAIIGNATHTIKGGPSGVPEELMAELRVGLGVHRVTPLIEGYGKYITQQNQDENLVLQLVGIDIFSDLPFRNHIIGTTSQLDVQRFVAEKNAVVIAKSLAKTLGVQTESKILIQVAGKTQEFVVIALVDDSTPEQQALHAMVFMDIASAQEALGRFGQLSQIDLIFDKSGADAQLLSKVKQILPASLELVPADSRGNALYQMTEAFETNLTALSLFALVVGIFLIYNTMTFSVIQRREIIGSLRTLGVTRGQIFRLVFFESLTIGAVATWMGILLGIAISQALLSLVTRTINDLYFVLTVQSLDVSVWSIVKGLALGLLATAVAGLMPALESSKSTPRASLTRSTLETNYRNTARWGSLIGSLLLVMSTLITMLPVHRLMVSFVGVFVVILGFAFLVPQLTLALVRLTTPVICVVFGSIGNISARGVARSLSRTGVAIAALSVALATIIGVVVMIDSFRFSVVEWLDNTLNADIFITPAGVNTGTDKGHLDSAWAEVFRKLPEVALVTTTREVQVQTPKGATDMIVVDMPESVFSRFKLVEGSAQTAANRFFLEDSLLVSESFAYHNNIGLNDMLALPTGQGIRTFKVVGVFTDYGSERGVVAMYRKVYNNYWSDRSISTIGLYAARGVNIDRLTRILHRVIDEQNSDPFQTVQPQELVIQTNQALKQATITIFDRTFVVTEVLRLLAILVAFVGVVSALMSIQFERKPEIALLRALGMTPPQVWAVISGETGLMGAIAGILAAPLGLILAMVLIFIINRRSFGWTIDVSIDPLIFVQSFFLAVTASLIAGIYPALQMSQNNPATGLRED